VKQLDDMRLRTRIHLAREHSEVGGIRPPLSMTDETRARVKKWPPTCPLAALFIGGGEPQAHGGSVITYCWRKEKMSRSFIPVRPFKPVEREDVERFGRGATITNPRPGDFILTHGKAWTSRLIQLGQKLRIHGDDSKYTYWNHAAIFVNANGDIIEALGAGVRERNIRVYQPIEYHVVRIAAGTEDREEAVRFARSCVDEEYGWVTIASIAMSLLTGTKFSFGFDGQQICSGLVARAMERTWAIFSRMPANIMPADLAKYYQVDPPKPSMP
jgi:hypothetical protein